MIFREFFRQGSGRRETTSGIRGVLDGAD